MDAALNAPRLRESSSKFTVALLLVISAMSCEGKHRKFGPALPIVDSGAVPDDASTPEAMGSIGSGIRGSSEPNVPDVLGPMSVDADAAGDPGCEARLRSCGQCDAICSVTEYCSASGCIKPTADLALRTNAIIRDFEIDETGAIFVTGSFNQPVNFGADLLDPGRAPSIFVAKYAPGGALSWVKSFGPDVLDLDEALAPPESVGLAIDVDESGNSYITGEIHGAVDFGGGLVGDVATNATEVYTSPGNVFIAGFDPAGAFRWANVHGSSLESGLNRGTALVVGSRFLYVAGEGVRGLDLGSGTIGNGQGRRYLFLGAFERSTGSVSWSRGLAYTAEAVLELASLTGLAIDSQEHIHLSGWWRGRLDLGAGDMASGTHSVNGTTSLSEAGYVSSYAPADGALRWVRVQQEGLLTNANAVAVDQQDSVIVAGSFVRPIDLGGGLRETGDDLGQKMFLVSYDSAGTHRFDITGRTPDGSGLITPTGAVAYGGRLLVSASYYGAVDVSGGTLISTSEGPTTGSASEDFALLSYDLTSVNLRWARHFGSGQIDRSSRVRVAAGSAVFGAFSRGVVDIDGVLVEPLGDTTSLLIRVTE